MSTWLQSFYPVGKANIAHDFSTSLNKFPLCLDLPESLKNDALELSMSQAKINSSLTLLLF